MPENGAKVEGNGETVHKILLAARRRIRKGWRKGELGLYQEPEGKVCLLGGLFAGYIETVKPRAYPTPGEYTLEQQPLVRAAGEAVRECLPPLNRAGEKPSITGFNDRSSTTKKKVLEALDCAVKATKPKPKRAKEGTSVK